MDNCNGHFYTLALKYFQENYAKDCIEYILRIFPNGDQNEIENAINMAKNDFKSKKDINRLNMLEFNITDIVIIKNKDEYFDVVGVIHDDKRLFISNTNFKEFEVRFSDVEKQYVHKTI